METDYVVADGPGSQTETSRALLLRADMAIVPCKASMLEVRALAKATEVLRQAQEIRNGKPSAVIVLGMIGKNYRLTKDMKDSAAALDLPLASNAMILRQIYADAPGQGSVVWNLGSRAQDAAVEVDQLFGEILPYACKTKSKKENRSSVKEKKMAERRALVEVLKTAVSSVAEPIKEEAFVFGSTKGRGPDTSETTLSPTAQTASTTHSRVPLSTRMRADFATALTRASLERQLASIEPNAVQDILEQAIEPWLRSNGDPK